MSTSYETDVVAWANEQAGFVRAGRFDLLDLEHIAEEIEDVGKSEQRELASRMSLLLAHLLKWEYQPFRRGSSWKSTIRTQREGIARRLHKTPSLKSSLDDSEWLADAWADGRTAATHETSIDFDTFPEICPWAMESEILQEGWLPSA